MEKLTLQMTFQSKVAINTALKLQVKLDSPFILLDNHLPSNCQGFFYQMHKWTFIQFRLILALSIGTNYNPWSLKLSLLIWIFKDTRVYMVMLGHLCPCSHLKFFFIFIFKTTNSSINYVSRIMKLHDYMRCP